VTFEIDRADNRFVVRYRPDTHEPVTDDFEFERCSRSESGGRCSPFRITVDLSEAGARREREACLPTPFQLVPGREIAVALTGARGNVCAIRLFLARKPLTLDMAQPPSSGRAWFKGARVLYRANAFSSGQDSFKVNACPRDGSPCTVLAVSVSQQ